MLISEHASFLGLHTAQLLMTLKLVYNMRDGVELHFTHVQRQISSLCIFHIFVPVHVCTVTSILPCYINYIQYHIFDTFLIFVFR